MIDNRERSIKKTLTYEGGYTNHPRDPGGPTNWGITIADARHYWKPDATAADVKAMPISVAVDIYRQHYWTPASADALPAGVDLVVFDFGVNSGVSRALKYLKCCKATAAVALVKEYCAKRLSFLHALSTYSVFGGGWSRRVADVEATGVKMAHEATGKPPEEVSKELHKEAKQAQNQANKDAGKTVGTAGGTVATGTQAPSPEHFDVSTKAGLILLGITVVVAVVYFSWRWFHNYQRACAYKEAAKC